jgi:hypothetical protein
MKRILTGGACAAIAGAALVFSLGATPAQAQQGGSYLRTCTHVRGSGDRIIADCRRVDGGWNRTVLRDANACTGDISNQNGQLTCDRGSYGYRGRYEQDYRYGSSGWGGEHYPRGGYYGR